MDSPEPRTPNPEEHVPMLNTKKKVVGLYTFFSVIICCRKNVYIVGIPFAKIAT